MVSWIFLLVTYDDEKTGMCCLELATEMNVDTMRRRSSLRNDPVHITIAFNRIDMPGCCL
jgi:hypothetical protein